jgi:hypothetical protein
VEAIFWRNDVDVSVKNMSCYHIDAIMKDESGGSGGLLPLYRDTKAENDKTWRLMHILKNHYELLCLCLSEFNEILFESEKVGGQQKTQ